MSFFTKHGNTKFVGDWKIGETEYSLLQTIKPIFDAGVFSISAISGGASLSGEIVLKGGEGCDIVLNEESKVITINTNFVVTDNSTTINATKITLGDGLEAIQGENGEAIIQKKRRAAIEFTSTNLSSNKLTVTDCQVGDFVIVDSEGVMVIPVIQQVDSNVQIDFTGWTISGIWKVIFR